MEKLDATFKIFTAEQTYLHQVNDYDILSGH